VVVGSGGGYAGGVSGATYGAAGGTSVIAAAPAISTVAAAPVSYGAASATHSAGMTQFVNFQGKQLPHFHEVHLRTLDSAKLREHANLLYSTIGHANLGKAVPVYDHELLEFIIWCQNMHLVPLLLV